jgi:hypothetical protein
MRCVEKVAVVEVTIGKATAINDSVTLKYAYSHRQRVVFVAAKGRLEAFNIPVHVEFYDVLTKNEKNVIHERMQPRAREQYQICM